MLTNYSVMVCGLHTKPFRKGEVMKKIPGIITLFLMVTASFANAANLVNPGFESGDTTGWSYAGDVSVVVGITTIPAGPNIWQVWPYEKHMGMLSTNGLPVGDLDTAVGAPAGTIAGIVPGAINGSVIWQDVNLIENEEVINYWAFVTNDSAPEDDSAFALLLNLADNSVRAYAKLASIFSNDAFEPPVGDYGATGWHGLFTASEVGNWRIAFGVVNTIALNNTSYLFLDEFEGLLLNTGGEVPEPSTLLLIGSGLLGLVGYGRRKLFKK